MEAPPELSSLDAMVYRRVFPIDFLINLRHSSAEERDTINRLSMAPQIAGVPFQQDD